MIMYNGDILDESSGYRFWEDRSYLFGDGLYEVIRFYNKKLRTPELHLERLFTGMEILEFECTETKQTFINHLEKVVSLLDYPDGYIYVQVSRGSGPRNHVYAHQEYTTNWIMMPNPMDKNVICPQEGIMHLLYKDIRWEFCNIKSVSLVGAVFMKSRGVRKGCGETILIRDGVITECSTSNLFMIKNNIIYTHPKTNHILPGVTRYHVMNFAKECGIEVREAMLTMQELLESDEVFSTNSVFEVTPATSIKIDEELNDGIDEVVQIGDGRVGPITRKIQSCFLNHFINKH